MNVVVVIALSGALSGCSGVAGTREHAGDLVIATHCGNRSCASRPQPRHLGDGCYALHDPDAAREHLYDCSTDRLPRGEASCIDVTPCTGACKQTITMDGRELAIERCLARWHADREAHRPPRTCSPARLQVVIEPGSATDAKPTPLPLPTEVVMEVWRSGKSRTAYTAESCVTDEGIVVGEPTRRTGFPKLDLVLHRKIAEQSSSASVGACAVVTLLVSHFDCEVDSVAL